MKHIGDITKINGKLIDPVDIITGGSPCQDLSVAGLRKGLAGNRSGLFMEQIRIIKEMREATNGKQPRFMVWENVPGAFSSNNGEDFRCVLEETARVADQDAVVPGLEGKQRWTPSGCIMGDGWSIAWRVHDAQFWGVPQRRKRIALVADFAGGSAPEILFEREGMSGNFEARITPWEAITACAESGTVTDDREANRLTYCIQGNCIDRADTAGCNGKGWTEDMSYTLNTVDRPAVAFALENHPNDSRVKLSENNVVQTLSGRMGTGGGNTPMILEAFAMQGFGDYKASEVLSGCKARDYKDATSLIVAIRDDVTPKIDENGKAFTLDARDYKGPQAVLVPDVAHTLKGNGNCDSKEDSETYIVAAVDCRNMTEDPDTNGTLQAKPNGGMSLNMNNVCRQGYIVRRLTPLECERLQGYPDGWTDIGNWVDSKGKKHKGDADSPRYKALGNSIALPFWKWMACRMIRYDVHTMGSLFDGIGGFPLVFSECGVEPVWASEIEEFCIAVTNKRFNEVYHV